MAAMYGATERQIIQKLLAEGAARREDSDGPSSLCFEKDGEVFFVPKPPTGGMYYTEDQLDVIEDVLRPFEIELRPLPNH